MRLKMLLATSLTASLVGCAGFPALHPFFIDMKNNVCYEYPELKPADACNLNFGKPIEHPISVCNNMYALPPEDIAALRVYQKGQCANKGAKCVELTLIDGK